jgi:hypothetical protein
MVLETVAVTSEVTVENWLKRRTHEGEPKCKVDMKGKDIL